MLYYGGRRCKYLKMVGIARQTVLRVKAFSFIKHTSVLGRDGGLRMLLGFAGVTAICSLIIVLDLPDLQ